MSKTYTTKLEVLEKSRESIGNPFKIYDKENRLTRDNSNKGNLGQIIEEGLFGMKINSRSEADFPEAGVELKVTPFIKGERGVRAKERLVLNIINYMTEHSNTFETSSFWKKNKSILLIFYKHIIGVFKGDFKIYDTLLYEFPEEDLLIIRNDWEKIVSKIREGKAHELSEGDTLYLGACTKGSTALKSMRAQPFCDTYAKQRAYSLKQSYMSHIVRDYVFGQSFSEKIIKNPNLLRETSFEDYIVSTVSKYYGKKQAELLGLFQLESTPKNVRSLIVSRMFGVHGKIDNTEEFVKANIKPKTIKVEANGRIVESMSFPAFKFMDIVNESWEDSTIKDMFEQIKYLFIVFQKNRHGELVFKGVKLWSISNDDLEEVRKVWEQTVQVINDGVVLTKRNNRTYNNFPKRIDNPVSHIRPHAKDKNDTYLLPDGRALPKQSFWLNNTFIAKQISDISNQN
jgi:DNA mismatch repair protein MutH